MPAKIPAFAAKAKSRFSARFADEAKFIRAWLDNPFLTGAVSPSGKQLARYMAAQVDIARPGPVIELGPGTGPVTQALVERGIAEERLILVEFDPDFCALLATRYPKAKIVKGDAYVLSETLAGIVNAPAAAIVSSLPLLLRNEPQRLALLGDAFGLMAAGAPYIQFTYGLKSPIPRLSKAGELPFSSHRSRPVWLNLPPAHVWVYRRLTEKAAVAKTDLIDKIGDGTRRMRRKLRIATRNVRAKIAVEVAKARRVAARIRR